MPQRSGTTRRYRRPVTRRRASTTRFRTSRSTTRSRSRRAVSTGPRGRTREQLYREAKRLKIPGRSSMNKAQLQRAITRWS